MLGLYSDDFTTCNLIIDHILLLLFYSNAVIIFFLYNYNNAKMLEVTTNCFGSHDLDFS